MELIFNFQEVDDAAKKLISIFTNSKIFAFTGEMGAGKTTFIHAICRQMGVTDKMSSPTYPIINQYKTVHNTYIYHIDLYRLKDTSEAIQTGVEECINSGEYCFIEWPEKIIAILPLFTINIFIEMMDNTQRRLSVNFPDKIHF
jgi:tRNA threonylcarbamoyladenosine biosynthesis protein TsaE